MVRGDARNAILGAAVGGILAVAGSLGTTALTQKHQIDGETRTAIGAARLLADDLRRAEGAMDATLEDCRYRLYDFRLQLPVKDQLLLAWRLKPGEWVNVSKGMEAVRLQIARGHETHPFVQDDVTQIKVIIKLIHMARRALKEVSGQPPHSRADLERELAGGGRC